MPARAAFGLGAALLMFLAATASASPGPPQRDERGLPNESLTRIVVTFDAGQSPRPGSSSLAGMDVALDLPALHAVVVRAPSASHAAQALAGRAGVVSIAQDVEATAAAEPNDPRWGEQYAPRMVGAPAAWATTGWNGTSTIVAIVDSGVDANHPDLQGRLLAGHDYVHGDGVPEDDCGHGTHVAGITAASANNRIGVAGVSQATILPMKALGATSSGCVGSLSNIAKAITDATDQGARVVSMSLTASSPGTVLPAAITYASQHGVLLVAAAGNSGGAVEYPAALPEVVAVSALDASKQLASYSSRGAKIELAAPGSGVLSTMPGAAYGTMSGTSMATPMVAGAAALALGCTASAGLPLDAATLRARLAATAEDLGTAGRDASFGFGLVRADRLVAASCPSAHAPVAAFTATPNGTRVAFDARASSDADGDALAYVWAFGDGGNVTTAATTADHTYAAYGAYNVTLTVVDGLRSGSLTKAVLLVAPTTPTAPSPPAAPKVTPASGANEWWIDVRVDGAPRAVAVGTAGATGIFTDLPRTTWGSWAKSIHILRGTPTWFRVVDAAGATWTVGPQPWLGTALTPAPTPPPTTSTFNATITPGKGINTWWVEAVVKANQPIGKVEASVNGGAWVTLPATTWGTWAKSMYAPHGAQVTFRATSATTGATRTATFTWP